MGRKIKDKAAMAARKRERKAMEVQGIITGADILAASDNITSITRNKNKHLLFGTRYGQETTVSQGIRTISANGTKHHFGFGVDPMKETIEFVNQDVLRMRTVELEKLSFDSGFKIKNYLRAACTHLSLFKLQSLLEYLVSVKQVGITISSIQEPLIESLDFVTKQLTHRGITWWGVKHFLNNQYKLGLVIPD